MEEENHQLRSFLKSYNDRLTKLIKNSSTKELFGVDNKNIQFSAKPAEFQLKALDKEIENIE